MGIQELFTIEVGLHSIALKSWLVNTFAHNQILLDASANRRLRIHQQTGFEAKFEPISHVLERFYHPY